MNDQQSHAPEGGRGGEFRIAASQAKVDALGHDAELILQRVNVLLEAIAALRNGTWCAGNEGAHEPARETWAYVVTCLAELDEINGGVTAAAIREHVRLGGTVDHLKQELHVPRWQAQRLRERVVGVKGRPVQPGPNETWARTGARPPGFGEGL